MNRIRELDGVRGIAILLVLIWHYFTTQVQPVPDSLLAKAQLATQLTWSGVDLFFVLSGFLIGGILLDNRASKNYFSTFFVRRACRILPLYVVMLLAYVYLLVEQPVALKWLWENSYSLWFFATFTQNYPIGIHEQFGPNWMAVTWSLAVEEQFYVVLPFLMFWLPPPLASTVSCWCDFVRHDFAALHKYSWNLRLCVLQS